MATKTRSKNSNFGGGWGRSSTYICGMCKKRTRQTGTDAHSVELCDDCFDEATFENEHNDFHETPVAGCVHCDAWKPTPLDEFAKRRRA